jgi:hypothetical protein
MKFISRENIIFLEANNPNIIFNTMEYVITKTYIFNDTSVKLDFDKYTIKISNKIMSLINNEDGTIDTLLLVQSVSPDLQEQKDIVFTIKKDTFVSINYSTNSITYNNQTYNVTNKKKNGSTDVYVCSVGTLEISNSPKRVSKWNGISIATI